MQFQLQHFLNSQWQKVLTVLTKINQISQELGDKTKFAFVDSTLNECKSIVAKTSSKKKKIASENPRTIRELLRGMF